MIEHLSCLFCVSAIDARFYVVSVCRRVCVVFLNQIL